MTKYERSPWIDRFPRSRVPALPRQRGPLKSDVVIIGGGLTGCTTAYAIAVARVKVVLVDGFRKTPEFHSPISKKRSACVAPAARGKAGIEPRSTSPPCSGGST